MRAFVKTICGILLAVGWLTSCSPPIVQTSPPTKYTSLEEHPDFQRVKKRLNEAYGEAIAHASGDQRVILERNFREFSVEREKLRSDPDAYIAATQQEIRYLAGNYDEP
jgi:hypothetical protein